MAAIAMIKDLKIIMERLTPLFKRKRNTRYWISLVNQTYTPAFNFFFNIQPKDQRQRSIPLHSLHGYDLAQLEAFLGLLRKQTQLTIEFVGFEDMRWPQTNRIIQRRARLDE
ncbi:acetyl-CoA carboxylase [Lacticaseibacillus casei]|nr:hypothetical protein [Lacticaseibacillus zeae]OLS05480.1 acetyl-CoA carboxylase [Lacticaseibacillus casei]QVI32955.1 acetyl-CoA carboxylase [Lacticaseibacillus zeae]